MEQRPRYRFDPRRYEEEIAAILRRLGAEPRIDAQSLDRALRSHPKDGRGFFSKSELLRGLRHLSLHRQPDELGFDPAALAGRLRMKPVRTLSGVAPVTVLTRPHPCPGRCIFCPSDVRMPKSYLSEEPGAQRAAFHRFDPYLQTLARLRALDLTGHRADKVELLILGGTWSAYPEAYQVWFVRRCLEALDAHRPADDGRGEPLPRPDPEPLGFDTLERPATAPPPASPPVAAGAGELSGGAYNAVVGRFLQRTQGGLARAEEGSSWEDLAAAQRRNESAGARCVGLVIETRPDRVTAEEVVRLRRLGVTKVQIGVQSVSDEVLAANRRGHGVAATRRAVGLLRRAGFKILAHWMANLYGSNPDADVADFERLFEDPSLRPDELKIYPCSLVENTELMAHWRAGRWRPYYREELLEVLTRAMAATPPWCRLTRVIRDIPGGDIVAGNKTTNLREVAEREVIRRGRRLVEIRSREVRDDTLDISRLSLTRLTYDAEVAREVFLQAETPAERLAGFLRLSLPRGPGGIAEISSSALIREVHVYGALVGLGETRADAAQHQGLGRRLIEAAAGIAREAGFADLAVISAVGTRGYYRSLGFRDGELYQHSSLATSSVGHPALAILGG